MRTLTNSPAGTGPAAVKYTWPSMSMESLRAAGEGVNVMLRKVVKSAWDKVDELKRNSLREAIVAKGEEAPLLEKPSSHV